MDTAQRGMGLDWPATRELIRRSAAEARAAGGALVVRRRHRPRCPDAPVARTTSSGAYTEQLEVADAAGARAVLMASRQLARLGHRPRGLREGLRRPARPGRPARCVLHWLGAVFDPALEGYWGTADLDEASATLLGHRPRPRGRGGRRQGVAARRRPRGRACGAALPDGVRLYTGDDFDYPDLILGDDHGHSDALLGIFDAIAPAAAAALHALDAGDVAGYARALEPDGAAGAARVRRADVRLQDRPGVPRLALPATRTGSRWSAAWRARAARSISARRSGSPTPPACCRTRTSPRARMRAFLTVAGLT